MESEDVVNSHDAAWREFERARERLRARRDASRDDLFRLMDSAESLIGSVGNLKPKAGTDRFLLEDVSKGFGWTVYHHAMATATLLVMDPKSYSSFVTARAAFEANHDLLYLYAGSQPTSLAARVVVADLFDRHAAHGAYYEFKKELKERGDPAADLKVPGVELEVVPVDQDFEDLIGDPRFNRTIRTRLEEARNLVEADRSKRRYHWSGTSRLAMTDAISQRIPWYTRKYFRQAYRELSRRAHPRARVSPLRNLDYTAALPATSAWVSASMAEQVISLVCDSSDDG